MLADLGPPRCVRHIGPATPIPQIIPRPNLHPGPNPSYLPLHSTFTSLSVSPPRPTPLWWSPAISGMTGIGSESNNSGSGEWELVPCTDKDEIVVRLATGPGRRLQLRWGLDPAAAMHPSAARGACPLRIWRRRAAVGGTCPPSRTAPWHPRNPDARSLSPRRRAPI